MLLPFSPTPKPAPKPDTGSLGFGKYFTDHTVIVDWDVDRGWHDGRVIPREPFALDPATSVLHYGQSIFDGVKAFRTAAGKVVIFRGDRHCARMAAGAPRLCMPVLPEADIADALRALVRADRDWVPAEAGTALYLRPTLIATECFLGVRPAQRYSFFVLASPVGAYYPEGLDPVRIWVEREMVRAAQGGLGSIKASANYAASIFAAEAAKHRGYSQVLWLDAARHELVEEVGTMNFFARIGDELVTPPLDGTILPGVTRDCVLVLAKAWGLRVSERPLSVTEIVDTHRRGALVEAFGTGTAAVIAPIGELGVGDQRLLIGGGQTGELAGRLYETISGIQTGRHPDVYGWVEEV